MNLKKKILLGYGFSFFIMCLVIGWSVENLLTLGKAADAILRENYRSIRAAEKMLESLERQNNGILLFEKDRPDVSASLRMEEATFHEWLGRAKDNITIEGESAIVSAIDSSYLRYRRETSRLVRNVPSDPAMLRIDYQRSVAPASREVRDACERLLRLNETTMYAASETASVVASRAVRSTAAAASAALLAALLFSLVLAERIVRPLKRLMDASRTISSGDYSARISDPTGDEIGSLSAEFNAMAEKLATYHEMNVDRILSEKNKSEAVLSSIADGLIIFDDELRIVGINPAARSIIRSDPSPSPALHCEDIFPDAEVCRLIGEIVRTGRPADIPDERRIISIEEKGRFLHYLYSATAIRGGDRGLRGAVLLLKDVTRLKEVERLKGEFIMAASHELRTPLTGLGMSIEILLERSSRKLDENELALLRTADEEVNRLKALVNGLLDISNVEAGMIGLEFKTMRLRTVLDQAVNGLLEQAKSKKVRITANSDDDLPDVTLDEGKITWVVSTLMASSIRNARRGGEVALSARLVGPRVHIAVKDDGPAIPEEYHAKVFQTFVHMDGIDPGGAGIALSICKEIVRAHGGAIWMESSEGKGNTFTFTIPVRPIGGKNEQEIHPRRG